MATPLVRVEHAVPYVPMLIELGPPIRLGSVGTTGGTARSNPPGTTFKGGFAAGLSEQSTVTAHDGAQSGLEIALTPAGARRLFRRPLSDIAGACIELDDLLPPEHRALAARMANLAAWPERIDALEALLTRALLQKTPRGPVETIAWACEHIEAAKGRLSIRELARATGYSPKHLGVLFLDHVGVLPKTFARVVRLDALVRHLRAGGRRDWAGLAAGLGFYDQAHLSGEVKRMTGFTPTTLAETILGFVPPADATGDLTSFQDSGLSAG